MTLEIESLFSFISNSPPLDTNLAIEEAHHLCLAHILTRLLTFNSSDPNLKPENWPVSIVPCEVPFVIPALCAATALR